MRSHAHISRSIFIFILLLTSIGLCAQTSERYLLTDADTSTLRVFNVSDNTQVGAPIALGGLPTCMAVSPNGRLAYVGQTNFFISVIDLSIGEEVHRIFGSTAGNGALTADGSKLITTGTMPGEFDEIFVYDARTFALLNKTSLDGKVGDIPNANDVQFGSPWIFGSTAYFETSYGLVVFDLTSYTASLMPGTFFPGSSPNNANNGGPGDSVVTTPDGRYLVAVRGYTNKAFIVDTTNGSVQTISFPNEVFAVAITTNANDPHGIYAYFVRRTDNAKTGTISVMDLNNGSATFGQVVSEVPVQIHLQAGPFRNPVHMALTADTSKLFVLSSDPVTGFPNLAILDALKLRTDPANAVLSQTRFGLKPSFIRTAFALSQPLATAPVVSAVSSPIVDSSQNSSITITGTNFASDALVRIGNLDLAPSVSNGSSLQVTVPAGSPAQGADIVVTNPNLGGTLNDIYQSGVLRNKFTIASPPTFQPVNQVIVGNAGQASVSVLNVSSNASVAPAAFTGPEPGGIAITPDGERAYVESKRPATVDVFNIATGTLETQISLTQDFISSVDGISISGSNPINGHAAAYVAASNFPFDHNQYLYLIDVDSTSATYNQVVYTTIIATTPPFLSTSPGPLVATGNGRYVYALDAFGDLIATDIAGNTTTATPVSSLGAFGSAPHLALDPTEQYLLLGAPGQGLVVASLANPMAPVSLQVILPVVPSGVSTPMSFNSWKVVGNTLYTLNARNHVIEIFNFQPTVPDFSFLGSFVVAGASGGNPTMDVTPDGHLVYISLSEEEAVGVVSAPKVLAGDPTALLTKIVTGVSPMGIAVRPGTPTPVAAQVTIAPIPQATITFSNVTAGGVTTVTTTNTSPFSVPAGFTFGSTPVYYEISTTATFAAGAEVCFSYDPSTIGGPESDLRMAHYDTSANPPGWGDVTVLPVDTVNHRICGSVTHFSPFVVGLGSTNYLFDNLIQAISASGASAGTINSLLVKANAARHSWSNGLGNTAVQQLQALEHELNAQSGKHIDATAVSHIDSFIDSVLSRLEN